MREGWIHMLLIAGAVFLAAGALEVGAINRLPLSFLDEQGQEAWDVIRQSMLVNVGAMFTVVLATLYGASHLCLEAELDTESKPDLLRGRRQDVLARFQGGTSANYLAAFARVGKGLAVVLSLLAPLIAGTGNLSSLFEALFSG